MLLEENSKLRWERSPGQHPNLALSDPKQSSS